MSVSITFLRIKTFGISVLYLTLIFSMQSIGATLQQHPVILVMGDSLSESYGVPLEEGWTALLQEKLDKNALHYTVVNASISGETSGGGLTRIDALLQQHQPSVVILELGANDGLRALSLKIMRENLQAIILNSQQQGATVLLLGMHIPGNYGGGYTKKFHDIFHQLAKQYALSFVPFYLDGVAQNLQLMQADGIHPNSAAQPLLLDNVWPTLRPLLK